MISCGKVSRCTRNKYKEDKGYFGKVCLYSFLSVWPSVFGCKSWFSLPGVLQQSRIYALILDIWGEGREPFLHVLILSCLQLKVIIMPKCVFCTLYIFWGNTVRSFLNYREWGYIATMASCLFANLVKALSNPSSHIHKPSAHHHPPLNLWVFFLGPAT